MVIFGPERLPKIAQQAGRTLRDLRRLADSATKDLREGLGPEFQDFDVSRPPPEELRPQAPAGDEFDLDSLDPRKFVNKHLLNEPTDEDHGSAPYGDNAAVALLQPGETPPYDSEAT